jgi:two-component system, chemotaxis family, chemotaxis protein CheY
VASRPRKILVVEDSALMRQLYRAVLSAEGAEIVYAENGAEALDCAAQNPDVDLFIVDINMPQMDGLEFLRRLRGELGLNDAPALVVSTEAEAEDHRAAIEAGASGYLKKPWTPPDLLAAVRRLYPAEPK